MTARDQIVEYLDERLRTADFADASMNGLQVQGTGDVKRIAVVTDAAMVTYEAAAKAGCQMIVAHHGLIWGGIKFVTGRNYEHLKFLLQHDINLYASHLPLDVHPELGNNAQLVALIDLKNQRPFGEYHGTMLGFMGDLPAPTPVSELAGVMASGLGCDPKILEFGPPVIKTVGVVSGRGGVLQEAVDRGLDCLITGEGTHENHHLALEAGIHVIYLGHYASETLGVKAVGKELADKFGVEWVFIDEPTEF